MSADDLVPDAIGSFTHAVTIDAPPDHVWPWIVQLGGGRAGWYSHDWIDNSRVPSATRIVPELQSIRPGDVMPAIPGATDAFVILRMERPRSLVLMVPAPQGRCRSSWEYLLEDLGNGKTRLVERARFGALLFEAGAEEPRPKKLVERVYDVVPKLPKALLMPTVRLGHRIMMAKHLRGIRWRAERAANA